ncbi:methyltransferase domain-containing protein [Clostridium tepidum]|uniref:class I SAM-dependent methyltransferase n=1 Tax=Clostridium tepidum TaxID=1962263 RepID=UPI002149BE86|nr:class I SAM-dependent methyltransferase [Clostridium tepidum]MCR1935209.1 methyltransferase domain-containing protein [Clostridium tepidum]
MSKEKFNNAVSIAKYICEKTLKLGDVAVDCTLGNGNDTILLANLVGNEGKVFSFDIQKDAIEKTKEKLKDFPYKNIILINDGHENLDKYIQEKVNLFIFNLGYLPGNNHNITTKAETTLKAVKKALKLLDDNGIVLLAIYHGHENGKEEKIVLEDLTSKLDQKVYNVMKTVFINQANNPPILICIEKR